MPTPPTPADPDRPIDALTTGAITWPQTDTEHRPGVTIDVWIDPGDYCNQRHQLSLSYLGTPPPPPAPPRPALPPPVEFTPNTKPHNAPDVVLPYVADDTKFVLSLSVIGTVPLVYSGTVTLIAKSTATSPPPAQDPVPNPVRCPQTPPIQQQQQDDEQKS